MVKREDIRNMIKEIEIDFDTLLLDPSRSLREQGFDSLDMATMFFEIEDRYSVKITDEDIANGSVDSIDKILDFLHIRIDN